MQLLFTITAQQISTLRGVSYKTARKEWLQIRDSLALEKKEPLYLKDLAAYYSLPPKELAEMLYKVGKK